MTLMVLFKLLVFEGLFYMYASETDCRNYYETCMAPGMVNHRSKLCDGKVECLDGSDESELHCGTGCLTTNQDEHRFINCGRKFIKIINAWNVVTDISLKLYMSTGQTINISDMYSYCNRLHQCDLHFTKGRYGFAVVNFQCEAFSSTSPSRIEPSLHGFLGNFTTQQRKTFPQTTTNIIIGNVCRDYYRTCLSVGMVNHRSKLCDGNQECLDGSDESELYCGTGCLTTKQYGHRIINCGRKFIKILNAWNVPQDYSLELYIYSGQAMNISTMYSYCSGLHHCDVYFTKGLYQYAVVKFQCETFSSTSSPRIETSFNMLNIISENFTTENKSFSQSTTLKMSIGEGKQLHVAYIIIGVIGGVIMCVLAILLLYRSQKGKDKNIYEQTYFTNKEDEYESIQR